jgi:putative glutamine amidotransferase
MSTARPIVVVPCDVKSIGLHPYHVVGEKYIEAVAHGAGCTPVLLPALGAGKDLASMIDEVDIAGLLQDFDGVFLTGSASNVDPVNYQHTRRFPAAELDEQRDETTLGLIRVAADEGVPLLGVCRGIQEINVAYGGSLHQAVHSAEGLTDHREDYSKPRAERYAPKHEVHLAPDGVLRSLHGCDHVTVNSLHGQGIDRLGEQLAVEATAADGLIEAVRIKTAANFAIGVQWHPEWRHWEDAFSSALFRVFGEAIRERARTRSS